MVLCGFTGGRREKRSPNYLYVKNPSTEKREKKKERKKAARKETKRDNKERQSRHGESEFLNIFLLHSLFGLV